MRGTLARLRCSTQEVCTGLKKQAGSTTGLTCSEAAVYDAGEAAHLPAEGDDRVEPARSGREQGEPHALVDVEQLVGRWRS